MDLCKVSPQFFTVEQATKLSKVGRCAYFNQVKVRHPQIDTALAEMESLVTPGSGTDIALLIGPTGVGKSALSVSLYESLINQNRVEIETDPGFIPVVLLSAKSSGEKLFSWKIFYTNLGEKLNEPLLDKKVLDRNINGQRSIFPTVSGNTISAMRMAVEKSLHHRRTILVIVDEAVHALNHAKGPVFIEQMNALKSLASIGGVTLGLVGSYDLYNIMCLSGQLARRSAIIHFRRYQSGVDEDERAFTKSIRSLQNYYPIEGVPELSQYAPELMRSCVGCVGILKETMQRALVHAIQKGKWDDGCLQKALLTEQQVRTILEENLEGENSIKHAVIGSGIFSSQTTEFPKAA